MIDCFNDGNWLGVSIEKNVSGSAKMYVDIRCVVIVIEGQGDAIRRTSNTMHISLKEIKVTSITTVAMGNKLRNLDKEI